jgi:hypothetical protein
MMFNYLTGLIGLPDFDRFVLGAAGQAVAELVEGDGPNGRLVRRQGGAANLGSNLLSQFSAIFGEKIGVFPKNQCHDQNFP